MATTCLKNPHRKFSNFQQQIFQQRFSIKQQDCKSNFTMDQPVAELKKTHAQALAAVRKEALVLSVLPYEELQVVEQNIVKQSGDKVTAFPTLDAEK